MRGLLRVAADFNLLAAATNLARLATLGLTHNPYLPTHTGHPQFSTPGTPTGRNSDQNRSQAPINPRLTPVTQPGACIQEASPRSTTMESGGSVVRVPTTFVAVSTTTIRVRSLREFTAYTLVPSTTCGLQ